MAIKVTYEKLLSAGKLGNALKLITEVPAYNDVIIPLLDSKIRALLDSITPEMPGDQVKYILGHREGLLFMKQYIASKIEEGNVASNKLKQSS